MDDNPYQNFREPTFATYQARAVVDLWLKGRPTGLSATVTPLDFQGAIAHAVARTGGLVSCWLHDLGAETVLTTTPLRVATPRLPRFTENLADVFILICYAMQGWAWGKRNESDVIYVTDPPVRRVEIALMYRMLSRLSGLLSAAFEAGHDHPQLNFFSLAPLTPAAITCEHIAQIWCRLQGERFTEETLADWVTDRLAYCRAMAGVRRGFPVPLKG